MIRKSMVRTALGVALGLAAAGACWAQAPLRIACVDMEKVFQGFYKTARSESGFQKQKDVYNEHAQELAAEVEAVKKQRDDLQERALNIALSDEVRAESRKQAEDKDAQYREKKKELQEFVGNKDKELGKKYLDLRAEIVKELTEFVRSYADRGKYDVVFDASGLTRNYIPVIVFSRQDMDITAAVVTEINRGHEDEIPKEAKDGAPAAPRLAPTDKGEGEAAKPAADDKPKDEKK